MTLYKKTLAIIALPAAVLFIITFFIVKSAASSYASSQTDALLLEKAADYTGHIESNLQTPVKTLSSLSTFFTAGNLSDSEILDVLRNFTKEFPETTGFYGVTARKVYLDGTGWVPPEGWNPYSRPWYTAAMKAGGSVVFSDVYHDDQTGGSIVSVSKAVYDGSEFLGVVAVDYPLASITSLVDGIKGSSDEQAFILTGSGNFAVHSSYTSDDDIRTVDNGRYKAIADILLSDSSSLVRASMDGYEYFLKSSRISGTDWHFVMGVPVSTAGRFIRSISVLLCLGFIIMFAVLMAMVGMLLHHITKPLSTTAAALDTIAEGHADLSQRLTSASNDEIGSVVSGFNKFVEKLQSIIGDIKISKEDLARVDDDLQRGTDSTAQSIKGILSDIDDVTAQVSNQSSSVDQTAGAVNEIASNIESLRHMIETQAEGVQQASAAVEEMIGNIASVNQSVDKMAASFGDLETSARSGSEKQDAVNERIEQIESQSELLQDANTAIAGIAEQTNLLAMNAAIEAAHAGEAGKGFSVVADEIRKLSETSSLQSKTIGEQLQKIRDSIGQVVETSSESGAAFKSVSERIASTDEIVRQIKAAMDEQNEGSQQIVSSLHSMSDSMNEVSSASAEMSEGNKAILEEVQHLQNATLEIRQSVVGMAENAKNIHETGNMLSDISGKMQASISQIGNKIDQFKV